VTEKEEMIGLSVQLVLLLTLCHAQTDVAQIIRSCGMFKLYKNRYLSGVKKFETVTGSLKECMETCCKSREIYDSFECHSFSYSATSNYCQLMEEKTTAKMQENGFYNFYLREPLVKKGVETATTCYEKRYRAFEWHWNNPADETAEQAPYIPECEPGQNGFEAKQCKTVWNDKSKSLRTIPHECFCVDKRGNELPGTRAESLTADQLDCTHAAWYTEYLVWRKSQFGAWFETFNAFLTKKEFDITKLPRACPASVQEEMCDETNRICYDDYFGCRYCHCALDIKPLIAGICSLVRQDNPKQCLTKAGNKVDSIKKCLAMGCCYTVDAAKTKIACYEQSGTVALVQAGAEPI